MDWPQEIAWWETKSPGHQWHSTLIYFWLGASSSVSALYSRLNSLKRVAFVDLSKPPTYKNSLPHQPNTRCFCWSQISLPTLKTNIFSENWWLEDDSLPFKLVPFFGGRIRSCFGGGLARRGKPLESHQVLRWLPRLNEEFTFGAQEDSPMEDSLQGRITYPTKREKEKHRLKSAFLGDMLVLRRVSVFGYGIATCFIFKVEWFTLPDLVFKPNVAKLYVSSTWFNHQLIVVWIVRSGWSCLTSCPHNS